MAIAGSCHFIHGFDFHCAVALSSWHATNPAGKRRRFNAETTSFNVVSMLNHRLALAGDAQPGATNWPIIVTMEGAISGENKIQAAFSETIQEETAGLRP